MIPRPAVSAHALRSHRNSLSLANISYRFFSRCVIPWTRGLPETQVPPPVVIGALGGSGTRLIVRILREAGYWMGSWCNPVTGDAMALRGFIQRHFDELVCTPRLSAASLEEDFQASIRAHRWGLVDRQSPWGWKNPRNMWIIPFLAHQYPNMIFIQLVRDGRDMALSSNHNLLFKHADLLLGDTEAGRQWRSDPIRAQLHLWVLGNRLAWEQGKELLGDRHLILRYEDLCAQPYDELMRLFALLGIPPDLEGVAEHLIVPSPGIGRWRASDHPALRHPDATTRATLTSFGYAP